MITGQRKLQIKAFGGYIKEVGYSRPEDTQPLVESGFYLFTGMAGLTQACKQWRLLG